MKPADVIVLTVVAVIGLAIYVIPGMVAYFRKIKPKYTIVVLNVIFAWIPIVWFGLLVWAIVYPRRRPAYYQPPAA